jgi:hypothetical protein
VRSASCAAVVWSDEKGQESRLNRGERRSCAVVKVPLYSTNTLHL